MHRSTSATADARLPMLLTLDFDNPKLIDQAFQSALHVVGPGAGGIITQRCMQLLSALRASKKLGDKLRSDILHAIDLKLPCEPGDLTPRVEIKFQTDLRRDAILAVLGDEKWAWLETQLGQKTSRWLHIDS